MNQDLCRRQLRSVRIFTAGSVLIPASPWQSHMYKDTSVAACQQVLSVTSTENQVTEPSPWSHNILISSQTAHSSVRLPALNLLELVVVDAHERNLSAAPLVELVATGLTAETLEQQLSAEVTEGQCKESLPHLWIKQRHTDQSHPGCTEHFSLRDTWFSESTYKVVCGERHVFQHFYMQLLPRQPRDVCVPANRLLLSETGSGEYRKLSTPQPAVGLATAPRAVQN